MTTILGKAIREVNTKDNLTIIMPAVTEAK